MAIGTVGITRVACSTSTGNQAITVSVGGLTPKAALFYVVNATTDAVAADNAVVCIGAATATTARWAVSAESQHGQATSNGAAALTTSACVNILSGAGAGTVDGTADFVSFGANTVTINWTDAPSSAWLMTVVAWAGDDTTAFAGTSSLGNTVDNAVDITGPGFEPDVVISATAPAITNGMDIGLGFVHNNRAGTVTQYSIASSDQEAATTACGFRLEDRGGIVDLLVSGALDFYGEYGTFDSSGFTVTTRNGGANNQSLAYLALRLDATDSAKAYLYATPTGTGAAEDTNPAFEPQVILYLTSIIEAAQSGATGALASSFGLAAVGASAQYSATISTEDNVADSNTQSLSAAQAFVQPLNGGAAGVAGTFTSFDSLGANYSYTAVTATAKRWPALAFKVGAVGGGDQELVDDDLTTAMDVWVDGLGATDLNTTIRSTLATHYSESNLDTTTLLSRFLQARS